MRVYEIAKEVGIPNKDLIAKIRALGLEVNNHMSSLDADDVARIKRSLEKEKHQVAAPAETKKLTSTGGVVIRRRGAEEAPAAPPVETRRAPEPPAEHPAPVETRRASEPSIERPAPRPA